MLTFDEQLRSIYIKSKKKTTNVNGSLKKEEAWKKTMEKSFWKKMKSRYENMNKKRENTNTVLKPSQRVVERVMDIGCQCLHLQAHQTTHVSFNDVRKKLKSPKKLNIFKKMKPCGETDEPGSKTENLSLVPYSNHQEPEVFMEARRHLAERLRLVALGSRVGEPSGSSCIQVPRTLEGILLSSPIHESMVALELEGTHGEKSLQKMWSGSSLSKQDENPSPVSVLDSFFSDNISSPSSTIESFELHIQPRRLDFEEHSLQTSSPSRKTGLSLYPGDHGFISSYVNDLYQISQSNWEDFLVTDYAYESSSDLQVLHDYVKEVLVGLHSKITLFGSRVKPFSLEKDVIDTVIDQVDWHNGQPVGPRTLDQLVRRDIAKGGPWLDTLSDRNDIVVKVTDEILEELVIEASLDICF
ncbi:uncharacterized protein LOC143619372 [Bidens hawaiensis]|uniref:uncharacterized protein LOC143619372 n=1 Tax=Bidens hawaiensis TaxID=980011 RepID=UPI00404B0BB2